MAVIITNAKDASEISPGDIYVIEPEGFEKPEHNPEDFAEAYLKLRDEVAKVLADDRAEVAVVGKTNNSRASRD